MSRPTFEHEVPADIRAASRPSGDCMVTPDGRHWAYTDDPRREGVSWRDGAGKPIAVAVWLEDDSDDQQFAFEMQQLAGR